MNIEAIINRAVERLALHPQSFTAHAEEVIRDAIAEALTTQRHTLTAESDKLMEQLAEVRKNAREEIERQEARHQLLAKHYGR